MPDPNQAQIEENSASNKNVQPVKTYGQTTVYATLPQGPNVSGSGKANLPPEPILGPTKPSPEPSPSSMAQFESVHPELKPMPDLTGRVTKENLAIYQYSKNQPIVEEPLKLVPSEPKDTSGLVNITATEETKGGVTTTTTIIPGEEKIYELKGTEKEQLAQLKQSDADTRIKMILAEELQKRYSGGEAVTVGNLPFSRTIDKSLNIKNSFGSSSNIVPQVSAVDALSVLVPGLGSGLISKASDLLAKVVIKGAKPASEIIAEELQNTKVPNIKTSTGLFGPEESQARGTSKFGKGGTSSSSTSLSGGGTSSTITPKITTTSNPSITGIFEKTETPGKGTTGVFRGDLKEGITTSTPDIKNQKLEYISSSSESAKGGLGGGAKENLGGGGTETKVSPSSMFSGKPEQVLKSFTKQIPSKTETFGGKQSAEIKTQSNQKEETFLKSFKSAEQIVSTSLVTTKAKTTLVEKETQRQKPNSALSLLEKNVEDTLQVSRQVEKLKPESLLIIKSKEDLLGKTTQEENEKSLLVFKQNNVQDLITPQQQQQKQESVLIFKQTTETPGGGTNTGTPGGGILLPPEEKRRPKKKKLKQFKAKEINFLGASTESTVVGLTGREELTYGNKKTAELLSKGRKLEKGGKYVSYLKNVIKYKSTKQTARPFSTRKPKNEFTSKKSKIPKF